MILSRYDVAQTYMILGGIPYYLNYMSPRKTFAENIDATLCGRKAQLGDEFSRLFHSLFYNGAFAESIVRTLGKKWIGMTRKELSNALSIKNGSTFGNYLKALEASGFLLEYVPFHGSKRLRYFKVIDPFCLFYLHILDGKAPLGEGFFSSNLMSQSMANWRGHAFENLCFCHVPQIKRALGISGVSTTESLFYLQGEEETKGMQIDMVLERKDNVVDLCEMKFYQGEFIIDKEYHLRLMERVSTIQNLVPRRFTIHADFVTSYGVKRNIYFSDVFRSIELDDLFDDKR